MWYYIIVEICVVIGENLNLSVNSTTICFNFLGESKICKNEVFQVVDKGPGEGDTSI